MREAGCDAVVIGAGPNGLAAAVALAQAGWAVQVYEASDTVGGGARSAELTEPGYVHDICSAVYPLGLGSPFFRSLPLETHGLQFIQPPLALAHPFDDGTAAVHDRDMQRTIASFGNTRDGQRHQSLFDPFASRWELFAREVLRPPHLPDSIGGAKLLARFGLHAIKSASRFVNSTYQGERAKALFAGIAAHSTLRMDQRPSAAVGLLLGIAGHAVGWPIVRGGAQRISDVLADLLRELGGEIHTSHRVTALSQLPSARAYLFDVTPKQLRHIAGDALPNGYCRRLDRYRYGPGVFKIDWALDEPIAWTASECREAGTIHLGGTLEEIADAERLPNEGQHAEQPFVLLSQPSLFDDSRAPDGKHIGWAYCHVPNGSTVDMTERIERQVERFAPGFRDLIRTRHTFNTAQLEQHNANCVGGDINGGSPDLQQLLMRPVPRLSPHTTPNSKIFLCSSSTPPGGGVHGMCGYWAAQAVLKRH